MCWKIRCARKAFLMGVVLVSIVTAQVWKREVIRDKFGDVSGESYRQTAKVVVNDKNGELNIVDNGTESIVIMISPAPTEMVIFGSWEVKILLRDESNKKVEESICNTLPNVSAKKVLAIGCGGGFLDKNTKYSIVLEGANWSARAGISGNSPMGPYRKKIAEERKKEGERKAEQQKERLEALSGSFTDPRDGQTYRTVKIGNQIWMAQNLNYAVANSTGSWCYNNSPDSCVKYGRLYNWRTAMNGTPGTRANPSGVQGVCPDGWHVPSNAEWTQLTNFAGNASTAGTKLKSATGWQSYSDVPAGTDEYGFSALPGGYGRGSNFSTAGNRGNWWSATETDADYAWYRYMYYNYEYVYRDNNDKSNGASLRCVRN